MMNTNEWTEMMKELVKCLRALEGADYGRYPLRIELPSQLIVKSAAGECIWLCELNHTGPPIRRTYFI